MKIKNFSKFILGSTKIYIPQNSPLEPFFQKLSRWGGDITELVSMVDDYINSEFHQEKYSLKKIQKNGETFYAYNKEIALEVFDDCFTDTGFAHFFESMTESKSEVGKFIDCGSHIGLLMLRFHRDFPNIKSIHFEPDTINFLTLVVNAVSRSLDVMLINAALSDREGKAKLFGDTSSPDSDTRGSSIVAEWGKRDYTKEKDASSLKLSKFLTADKIWLKIDIEGEELNVLREVIAKKNWKNVQVLHLEIHMTNKDVGDKHSKIIMMLKNSGLKIVSDDEQIFDDYLPRHVKKWKRENFSRIFIVQALRY